MKKSNGFSLIELVITLAIIAIIAAIALPSFNDSTTKGRRADGQGALVDLASKMEAYFYTNRTYTEDLDDLGYGDPAQSPEGHYSLSVQEPTDECPITSCYVLEASGIGAQAEDGDLTLNSLGQRLPADRW